MSFNSLIFPTRFKISFLLLSHFCSPEGAWDWSRLQNFLKVIIKFEVEGEEEEGGVEGGEGMGEPWDFGIMSKETCESVGEQIKISPVRLQQDVCKKKSNFSFLEKMPFCGK